MCHLQMLYKSSITNLTKYIEIKHPAVNIRQKSVVLSICNDMSNGNTIAINANSRNSLQSSVSGIFSVDKDEPKQPIIKKSRINV